MIIKRTRNVSPQRTDLTIIAQSHAEAQSLAEVLSALYELEFDRLLVCDPLGRPLLTVEGPIHVQARHKLDRRLLETYRTR